MDVLTSISSIISPILLIVVILLIIFLTKRKPQQEDSTTRILDQEIGKLKISLDEKIIATLPLEALEENPYGSLWQRLRDTIQLWFENE